MSTPRTISRSLGVVLILVGAGMIAVPVVKLFFSPNFELAPDRVSLWGVEWSLRAQVWVDLMPGSSREIHVISSIIPANFSSPNIESTLDLRIVNVWLVYAQETFNVPGTGASFTDSNLDWQFHSVLGNSDLTRRLIEADQEEDPAVDVVVELNDFDRSVLKTTAFVDFPS